MSLMASLHAANLDTMSLLIAATSLLMPHTGMQLMLLLLPGLILTPLSLGLLALHEEPSMMLLHLLLHSWMHYW